MRWRDYCAIPFEHLIPTSTVDNSRWCSASDNYALVARTLLFTSDRCTNATLDEAQVL